MNFSPLFTNLGTQLQNFFAPPRCQGCASLLVSRALVCVDCNQTIQTVITTKLAITASVEIPVFAAGAYQGLLKRLICAKYARHQAAGAALGEFIWYRTPIATMPVDYFIAVPLHWTRTFVRGFNQTDEMATMLSRLSGKSTAPLLKRTKRTAFQSALAAAERLQNVSDAFTLTIDHSRPHAYTGKHLVLVDDLLTTGATVRAACRQLLKLRPASIICVVAARTT